MQTTRTAVLLTIAGLAAQPLLAQGAKLSVLSGLQPGALLHVGVTTPDKLMDRCLLFVATDGPAVPFALQGVPVVIGASHVAFGIPTQTGASIGDNRSTEFKWRFDVRIPATVPVGARLHMQAVVSSSNPAANPAARLTQGSVHRVATPSVTETRYGLQTYSGGFRIYGIDVDTASLTTLTSQPFSSNGWLTDGCQPPDLSPDGRFVAVSMNVRTSNGAGHQILPFVFDLQSRTGTWISTTPVSSNLLWGKARFRPGVSDRAYVLTANPNVCICNGSGSWQDYNHGLREYDVLTGAQLAQHTLNSDPATVATGNRTMLTEWTFDSSGRYACFKTNLSHQNTGRIDLQIFTVGPGRLTARRDVTIHGNSRFGGQPLHAIPNSTFIVVTAGADKLAVVDAATGQASQLYAGPGGAGVLVRAIAPDGSFLLLQDKKDPRILVYIDGRNPITTAGSVRVLRSESRAALDSRKSVYILPGNQGSSVLIGGGSMRLLEHVTDPLGNPASEFVHTETGFKVWNQGKYEHWYADITIATYTKGGAGLLLLAPHYYRQHFLQLDLATMTFASLRPPNVTRWTSPASMQYLF